MPKPTSTTPKKSARPRKPKAVDESAESQNGEQRPALEAAAPIEATAAADLPVADEERAPSPRGAKTALQVPPSDKQEKVEKQERQERPERSPEQRKPEPAGEPINIAKLQAMPMPDLNRIARDMGIENFGTMRKHEVIFHILQKN